MLQSKSLKCVPGLVPIGSERAAAQNSQRYNSPWGGPPLNQPPTSVMTSLPNKLERSLQKQAEMNPRRSEGFPGVRKGSPFVWCCCRRLSFSCMKSWYLIVCIRRDIMSKVVVIFLPKIVQLGRECCDCLLAIPSAIFATLQLQVVFVPVRSVYEKWSKRVNNDLTLK